MYSATGTFCAPELLITVPSVPVRSGTNASLPNAFHSLATPGVGAHSRVASRVSWAIQILR